MTDSEKLDLVLSEMQEIKQRTTSIESKVTEIEEWVTKEYLDLSRKLNECIKLSSDIKDKQEIQDIYINMYNNKLKVL